MADTRTGSPAPVEGGGSSQAQLVSVPGSQRSQQKLMWAGHRGSRVESRPGGPVVGGAGAGRLYRHRRGREETQLVRKENTSREGTHMVDQIGVSEPALELRWAAGVRTRPASAEPLCKAADWMWFSCEWWVTALWGTQDVSGRTRTKKNYFKLFQKSEVPLWNLLSCE